MGIMTKTYILYTIAPAFIFAFVGKLMSLILYLKRNQMQLFNVPRNSKVILQQEESFPIGSTKPSVGETYMFHHIDGMYSYCTNEKGEVVHLPAWAAVEIVP